MSGSIYSWSTTATDNEDADGDINWAEGQNAKTVNNSARQMMGRLAEFLLDLGGQGTVGGTANAITLTLESSFTVLKSGLICALQPASDNTGAVTLNVNGIGAKAIRKFDTTGEVALASGDLQDGNFYLLIYDTAANSSAGAWIVLNPTAQPQSSKLTDIAALAVTDGNIIVGNGTTWVAESGATARTSLGLATIASSGSYDDLSGTPTLGTAASKNVGTTSGTVAAGDDSRITGAVQKSATSTSGFGFVIDEDTMSSDSATKVPTQQSVKAYVDANAGGTPDYGAGNAALAAGSVGTYALARAADPGVGTKGWNTTVAGSNLNIVGMSTSGITNANTPTGTWRVLGTLDSATACVVLRIS